MKIVILDGYTLNPGDLNWDGFHKLGDVTYYDRTPEHQIVERIGDAEIVITNKTPIRKETFDACNIKYVGVLATGYNVVDVKAASDHNVVVTNIPAYGTETVAQHVFALLLEICQNVGLHNQAVKNDEWHKSRDFCFWKSSIIELSGKTLGIVGLGRIGRAVAKIASAFGMNVIAYSRTPKENIPCLPLNDVLSKSDVISLHCPLTDETEHLINEASLKLMKSSAILINTSRGPLIDEEALYNALSSQQLYAAGIDVLDIEPPVKAHKILELDNCFVTPHIAWASKEARTRLMNTAVDNLSAFINNKVVNQVN